MSDELQVPTDGAKIEQAVDAFDQLLEKAEWFAIVGARNIALRFGPFTEPEMGRIITQCVEEKLPMLLTASCGRPMNWAAVRAICGKDEVPGEVPKEQS